MKLHLQITPAEGDPYTVTTNLFVLVATERKFKVRSSDFANGIGMEHLAFMAYEAAKLSGVAVPAVFDDFVRRLDSVEVVEEEPNRPTSGGQ
jgi:hypothetical protein